MESGDKLYNYIKGRLEKENLLVSHTQGMINGYQTVAQDGELERYRQAYGPDGFQFQRRPDGIYANRPPLKEWVKAEVINY